MPYINMHCLCMAFVLYIYRCTTILVNFDFISSVYNIRFNKKYAVHDYIIGALCCALLWAFRSIFSKIK